jgi:hypothetical protein
VEISALPWGEILKKAQVEVKDITMNQGPLSHTGVAGDGKASVRPTSPEDAKRAMRRRVTKKKGDKNEEVEDQADLALLASHMSRTDGLP